MEFFTNDVIRGLLASSLETAALTAEGFKDVGKGPGSRAAQYVDFLTIPDQKRAVIDDVERIRNHPLVPASIPFYGYLYDVKTGKLIEIEEAKVIRPHPTVTGPAHEAVHQPVLSLLFQHAERLHSASLWKGTKSEGDTLVQRGIQ